MRVSSPAFEDGAPIPKKYTEDGQNISPPLRIEDVPAKTREFALIVDDPDAPRTDPWVHWVMFSIPRDAGQIPEAVPRRDRTSTPPGAVQGRNSWQQNNIGYRGPAPPHGHGTHHYHFRVYALDAPIDLEPGIGKDGLLAAIRDHIVDKAELVGTYERR